MIVSNPQTPIARRPASGRDPVRWAHAHPGRIWREFREVVTQRWRSRAAVQSAPVELGRGDMVPIVFHYVRLDPEDRMRRFNGRVGFMALFGRYSAIDWEKCRFLGCRAGGRIVGLVELCDADAAADGPVEAAISVHRDWQRHGLGEALLGSAVDRVCRDEGRVLILSTQTDNLRLIRLARRLGAEVIAEAAGETELAFRAG